MKSICLGNTIGWTSERKAEAEWFLAGLFGYLKHNWELKKGWKGGENSKEKGNRSTDYFFSLIEAEERQSRKEEPTAACSPAWLLRCVFLQADYSWSKRESLLPFMICFPSPLWLEYLSVCLFVQLCSGKPLSCNSKEIPGGWAPANFALFYFPRTLREPRE